MSEPPDNTSASSSSTVAPGSAVPASLAGRSTGSPPAASMRSEYVRCETFTSMSSHTVQAARSNAALTPMTGRGAIRGARSP